MSNCGVHRVDAVIRSFRCEPTSLDSLRAIHCAASSTDGQEAELAEAKRRERQRNQSRRRYTVDEDGN